MGINWTTVISSALVAMIIGVFQLIGNRYAARVLDKIEKMVVENNQNRNSKDSGK